MEAQKSNKQILLVCNSSIFFTGDLKELSIEDDSRILYDGHDAAQLNQTAKRNPNANGSLIAVSYEARARNVKRNDRGLEAIAKCPELCIIQVPVSNGKANLNIYRDASERLMTALVNAMKDAALEIYQNILTGEKENGTATSNTSISASAEKASVDEIYIDMSSPVSKILGACADTKNWKILYELLTDHESASTHTTIGGLESSESAIATNKLSKHEIRRGSNLQVVDSNDAAMVEDIAGNAWWSRRFPEAWNQNEIALAIGSLIALKARQAIVKKFNGVFTLSAGISNNKVMAKLAGGLKKPNRQTLINPSDEVTLQKLFHPLPLGRVRGLGGKFGDLVEETLRVKTMGELAKVPLSTLREYFDEKQANFLFRIAQGICDEPVCERTKVKQIGAGKTFQGVLAIPTSDHEKLQKWLGNLVADLMERLGGDTTRFAKTLTCWLSMRPAGGGKESRRSASQSAPLPRNLTAKKCSEIAFQLAQGIIADSRVLQITSMSLSAGNFVSIEQGSNSILDAFQRQGALSPTAAAAPKQSTIHKATSKKPNGIAAFLTAPVPVVRTGHNKQGSLDPPFPDTSTTCTASSPKQEGTQPVSDNRLSESSIMEPASSLQKLGVKDAPGVVTADEDNNCLSSNPPTRGGGISPHDTSDGHVSNKGCLDDDPDLEYAKQLQASFDRENEVIASMEQKQRSSLSSHKPGKSKSTMNNKKRRKSSTPDCPSISSFFAKKPK